MKKVELFLEAWLPLLFAIAGGIAWRYAGTQWGEMIKAPKEIIYQTMLMFSTIVVALMATFKAIIFTAEKNIGIELLRTNTSMHGRFVNYIFICIMSNLCFSLYSFALLVVAHVLDSSIKSVILVFLAIYSVFSLLQVLILFQFIVNRRA